MSSSKQRAFWPVCYQNEFMSKRDRIRLPVRNVMWVRIPRKTILVLSLGVCVHVCDSKVLETLEGFNS